ncbi:MAG TPA: hypothetical protein VH436_01515 [Vicinamibacterales bacterium]
MANDRRAMTWVLAAAVMCGAASLAAQERKVVHWEVGNRELTENVPAITGAPFTADATTEFTQVLADGNRIEQRYSTSIARDGRGRTRREQEMALVGPLTVLTATLGAPAGGGREQKLWLNAPGPQRLVVISDPVERVSYTLDEQRKEARRSGGKLLVQLDDLKRLEANLTNVKRQVERANNQPGVVVEDLGTRQIEGVAAKGTRTTSTIAAGEIGNLAPISLVTERWFSDELGMAVRISRSDPRSGETVYRLANIVRAEPPPDLFTVPSDYKIIDPDYDLKLKEYKKTIDAGRSGGGRGKQ